MRTSVILSGLSFAASALAQAVSVGIAPSAAAPSGCSPNFSGNFTLNVLDISYANKAKSPLLSSSVTVTLKDGVLYDSLGRVGDIVANRQFQFDGPPQAGAIYTGGWSACSNGSLALGGSTIFYACTSGEFRNLYDENVATQCSPVDIIIIGVGASSTTSTMASTSSAASSVSSGSASKTASTSGSASSTFVPVITRNNNGTIASTITSMATVSTTGSAATTGTDASGTAGTTGASAAASSTRSTGAAVATLAAARDILGAAVGAFGAAVILF